MSDVTILSQAIGTYSIEDSQKLQKEALAKGFTQAQMDAIAKDELASHGNWCYTAFKAKVLGPAFALLFPFFIFTMVFHSPQHDALAYTGPVVFALLAIVVGITMAQWGGREEKRSAVASAVLRVRTSGMSVDEISVFKDQPAFRKDRDTQRMLTSVQESLKAPPAATA